MTDSPISLDGIEEALRTIDPVFLGTPQFRAEALSDALDCELVFKIETLNPIRSFKGRGASYFAARNRDSAPRPWITASAGNFGQGLAYAARKDGIPLVVFAAERANPFKVARMRRLGAEVRLVGSDFDEAKDAARRFAEETSLTFIEDGRDAAISEGAGTIAPELLRFGSAFDVVLVPLGNGALINGIGTWMKAHAPATQIVGTGTVRAPAMERSFRQRKPVALSEPVTTIADGVAPRIPVPEAVATMLRVVDDVLLVEEEAIADAMRTIFEELGLVVEGAGAVTFAAASVYRDRFPGKRVALIVGGGNASPEDRERILGGR
jgi:threonine dehydratase